MKLWHKILCKFNRHQRAEIKKGGNQFGTWQTIYCDWCEKKLEHTYHRKEQNDISGTQPADREVDEPVCQPLQDQVP